MSSKRENI